MKKSIIIFLTLLLFLNSGCAKLSDVSGKANGTSVGNNLSFDSSTNSQRNFNGQKSDSNIKLTRVDSLSPLIWYGEIDSRDLESVGEIVKYSSYGLLTGNQFNQSGKAFEVDVLNDCAACSLPHSLNTEREIKYVPEPGYVIVPGFSALEEEGEPPGKLQE